MPIVPQCTDCKPMIQPESPSAYVTQQEVLDSISTSSSVQVATLTVLRGQVATANFVTRQAGKVGWVVLIPLSGDPNLKRIFAGSASHPDFDWAPLAKDLKKGAMIEIKKFVIPYAESLTVWVTSAANTSRFMVLYSEY